MRFVILASTSKRRKFYRCRGRRRGWDESIWFVYGQRQWRWRWRRKWQWWWR